MKRIGLRLVDYVLICAWCLAVAGCGRTADDAKDSAAAGGNRGGVAAFSVDEMKDKIGEYMPPLEGGSLEIAAPRDWQWSRPSGGSNDYLVGFHKKGSSLNSLPRILVSVKDSPFPEMKDVKEGNVGQLAALVSQTVDASKLKGTVQPLILGNTACARYVDMAKKRNALVARQTLMTVVGGRLYTIRLEAYDREFTTYRDAGYAVAASMKFSPSDTAKTKPEPSDE